MTMSNYLLNNALVYQITKPGLLCSIFYLLFTNFFTLSHNSHTRGHPFKLKLLKPPAYPLCRVSFFGTRVINDWNYLTSDIVTNSSLNQL